MIIPTGLLALIAAADLAFARPAAPFASLLTPSSSALRDLPVGKTPVSRDDMAELARLAISVNAAYCPHENRLQPHPANSLTLHSNKRDRHRAGSRQATSIIVTSDDVEGAEDASDISIRWYISHTPSTQTLTLAFSSLNSVDDLLELLASTPTPANNATIDPHLVDLPSELFPSSVTLDTRPRIHHSLTRPLSAFGIPALRALMDLIENPPMTAMSKVDILHSYIAVLTGSRSAPTPFTTRPIRHVEIVGHGLGSALGLLVATALHLEHTPSSSSPAGHLQHRFEIAATLFGLPRVGDQPFADLIDALTSTDHPSFRLHRITSYADTIVHLPERHQKLAHPSKGEIWVGADPRVAYACKSASKGTESELCAASIALAKTSVLDHSGPFGGVWINPDACRFRS